MSDDIEFGDDTHVSEHIAERLNELGASQADLARATGISRPTINRLCNGQRPKPGWMAKIGKALGLPARKLYLKQEDHRFEELKQDVDLSDVEPIRER